MAEAKPSESIASSGAHLLNEVSLVEAIRNRYTMSHEDVKIQIFGLPKGTANGKHVIDIRLCSIIFLDNYAIYAFCVKKMYFLNFSTSNLSYC